MIDRSRIESYLDAVAVQAHADAVELVAVVVTEDCITAFDLQARPARPHSVQVAAETSTWSHRAWATVPVRLTATLYCLLSRKMLARVVQEQSGEQRRPTVAAAHPHWEPVSKSL